MIGIGGAIRVDTNTLVSVTRTPAGIELGINHRRDGSSCESISVAVDFADAEHIAGLLADLARIARFQSGVGRLEVA
jgi:hypothetical protein